MSDQNKCPHCGAEKYVRYNDAVEWVCGSYGMAGVNGTPYRVHQSHSCRHASTLRQQLADCQRQRDLNRDRATDLQEKLDAAHVQLGAAKQDHQMAATARDLSEATIKLLNQRVAEEKAKRDGYQRTLEEQNIVFKDEVDSVMGLWEEDERPHINIRKVVAKLKNLRARLEAAEARCRFAQSVVTRLV